MYVCICNALTESRVKEAARQCRGSVPSVYECFGVKPGCGKCASSLRDILRSATGAEQVAAE
jgi:bacterioferritin-associated ferredoxin